METRAMRSFLALVVGLGLVLTIGLALSGGRVSQAAPRAAAEASSVHATGLVRAAHSPEQTGAAGRVEGAPAQPDRASRPVAPAAKIIGAGTGVYDLFGYAVAMDGDTLAVGAYGDDDNGSLSGAVYVFALDEGGADGWTQTSKVTAADGSLGDRFGYAVAVDGDTLAVGAIGDQENGDTSGSAYIFARNEGGADEWGLVTKITATDGYTDDHLGCAVAVDGDILVVGALYDDTSGSAYIFARNEGGADNWGLARKLTATDGVPGAYFGHAVAIQDDTVVVGALYDDDNGSYSGSVYVFGRNEGGADQWGQTGKITASDGLTGAYFGHAVAIHGDVIVVGADGDDDNGDGSGSAYVFARNEGGADRWGQVTKITATDGITDDFFGRAVAIHGDTIVVGAEGDDDVGEDSGSAYIFARNEGGADRWGLTARIGAADGITDALFGSAVAIHGDTVVAGAYGDDDNGSHSGSAYLFTLLGGDWEQEAHPVAPPWLDPVGALADQFGHAVALDGDTAVVGAYYGDSRATSSGSVYVFRRNQGGENGWGLTAYVSATDGAAWDQLGYAVAIDGDTIVAGAPYDDDNGDASGSAYVFRRNQGGAGSWAQTAKLTATDGTGGEEFGFAVGVSGDTVVVGARGDNPHGTDSGSAYVFGRNEGGADEWGLVTKISGTSGTQGWSFGTAVAVDGGVLIVGAPGLAGTSGAAYVFYRHEGGVDHWGQVCKKTGVSADSQFGASVDVDGGMAVVGAPGADKVYVFAQNEGGADNWGHVRTRLGASVGFGSAVALDGDTIVAGIYGDNGEATAAGAALVFRRNEGGEDVWGRAARLVAGDAAELDAFGWAVAIDGEVILVGAYGDDSSAGSAYVFRETPFAVYLPLVLREYP